MKMSRNFQDPQAINKVLDVFKVAMVDKGYMKPEDNVREFINEYVKFEGDDIIITKDCKNN